MSVSNSRHSLLAYFSSKSMGKRFRSRIAAVARSAKRRSLRLEALERRELMASDVASGLHNALVPTDVNGDFDVTPIDVLQVINAINRQSRNTSASLSSDDLSERQPMVDVNNDGDISPIDALMVINHLRTGEGVGELAEVGIQVLNAAGTAITPTVGAGGVAEYSVAPGERFSIRTRAKDLRTNASGVFSTFVDLNYATEGSATTELAQVLWSEVQTLRFSLGTNGGTFTLAYGNETTAPITYSTNLSTLRNNISAAIGALSFVGGTSNLRVASETATSTEGPIVDVFFIGSLARQDIQNVAVGSNNLTNSSPSGSTALQVISNSNPSDKLVLSSAISFPSNTIAPGTTLVYNGGNSEAAFQTIGTTGLRLDEIGNLANALEAPEFDDPTAFVNVADTAFLASNTPGRVEFNVGPSGSTRLTVLLYGSDDPVADNLVDYPDPFRIVIASDLLAVNDTVSVNQDSGATTIVVGANDSNLAGTSFFISDVGPSSGGTAVIVNGPTNQASAVSFTPNAGFSGQTTFTYIITNNQTPVKTSTATVTVNVNAPNNAPVALTTPLNATEAGPSVTFTSAMLFSPGAGESTQTVTLSSSLLVSGDGSFTFDANGVTYTPPSNDFMGPVVFTVVGTDNGNPVASTTGTFTINVADVNDPPVVRSNSVNATEDIAVPILASDLFAPGPANESPSQTVTLTSATAVAGQTGGTISLDGSGNARFVPTAEFSGTFLFTAVAQDNGSPALSSPESTFTITVAAVNDAPTAVPDTGAARFTVARIPSQTFDLNVLGNDSSGDVGDTITVTAVTQPASGLIEIGPNGSNVRYTPAANTLPGSVQTFSYTITDGANQTSMTNAEISIDPPTRPFATDDTAQVAQNGSQIIILVLDNDFANTNATKQLLAIASPLNPSNAGTLVLLDNNTPSDSSDDRFGFTPASGFTGPASFTYRMSDTSAGSVPSVGTVAINVGELNDAPIVIRTTPIPGTEDTPQTIVASTLFSPGPADEASQTLVITNATAVAGQTGGTVSVVNGEVRFVPADNFSGSFAFTATAEDNGTTNGLPDPKSTTGTFTISVAAVNDAPTANATASITTPEDTALTINASSLFSAGPADESSQTLVLTSVSAVTGQTGGSIALSSGAARFTPAQNFVGTFTFVAVAQDNGTPAQSSPSSTFTITVTPVNDAPVPVNANRSANATIATNFDLSTELAQASRGGGTDEAGQTVRITNVRKLTTNGNTVSINSDGTIRYLAAAGFSGPDTIEYTITDDGTTNGAADPKTGVAILTINVAAFVPSSVSGQVWIDDDADTTIESNEMRLGGVEITLTGRAVGATADITPIRMMTRTDGSYTFDGLSPGNYVVTFTPPTSLIDAPASNSIALNIVAPGGTNTVQNFAVHGFESAYSHLLDNLESSYYLRNGQQWRQRGLTSLVLPNGSSAWTAHHGGFEGFQSGSIRVAADGVYVRVVQANSSILETKLPRSMYVSCSDGSGNTLVRVFATPANLTFAPVINSAEGESYASNVDRFFSQLGS